MPSLALRMATDMPLICDVILLAMARPAASSLALLMRLPVDRRSSDAASDISALFEALAERIADTLVPIIVISKFLPRYNIEAAPFELPFVAVWRWVTGAVKERSEKGSGGK